MSRNAVNGLVLTNHSDKDIQLVIEHTSVPMQPRLVPVKRYSWDEFSKALSDNTGKNVLESRHNLCWQLHERCTHL